MAARSAAASGALYSVSHSSLDPLLSRLDLSSAAAHERKRTTDTAGCLGKHHHINHVLLAEEGRFSFDHRNARTGHHSFTTTVLLARLSFDVVLQLHNRAYTHMADEHKRIEQEANGARPSHHSHGAGDCHHKWDGRVVRKHLQMIGVSVGDILKHAHYTTPIVAAVAPADVSASVASAKRCKRKGASAEPKVPLSGIAEEMASQTASDTDGEESDPVSVEDRANSDAVFWKTQRGLEIREQLMTHMKRASAIDCMGADARDPLGYLGGSNGSTGRLVLWDALSISGHRTKLGTDFASFCKRIVYFSTHHFVMWKPVAALSRGKVHNELVPNAKSMLVFLDNLSTYRGKLAVSLLRYFCFQEDPECGAQEDLVLHRFDPPKSVCDVLQFLHDRSEGDDAEAYLERKNAILNCRLNSHQQQLLEIRYPRAVFHSILNVPTEWPLWALRNVLLRTWISGNTASFRSYAHIDHACNLDKKSRAPAFMANDKYKFRTNRSGKYISEAQSQQWRYGRSGCSCCRYDTALEPKDVQQEIRATVIEGRSDFNLEREAARAEALDCEHFNLPQQHDEDCDAHLWKAQPVDHPEAARADGFHIRGDGQSDSDEEKHDGLGSSSVVASPAVNPLNESEFPTLKNASSASAAVASETPSVLGAWRTPLQQAAAVAVGDAVSVHTGVTSVHVSACAFRDEFESDLEDGVMTPMSDYSMPSATRQHSEFASDFEDVIADDTVFKER